MLKLKNVSKYYYKDGVITTGFSKVNLELHLGEFVVITGESGSGKSTLLNVLSGLDTYEDGEMYINGEETSHYKEEDYLEYRRKYVSNIFQNFNLVNSYTVYENIELAMLMNGKNRSNVKKRVLELIDLVGLKKYKNTKTSKLSGGQKQRVAIARALATDTPVIVADEPTGSLDKNSSKQVLKLLHEISKDKLVIVVTHNKKEIEEYATRLIRMHDGNILENRVIEKIDEDKNLESKEVKDITFISKLRLAIRNTFNLPIKFILMFVIFALIITTFATTYSSFRIAENEEYGSGYNQFFMNSDDKRIVIKKDDLSPFSIDDYNKISNIKGIDYIVKEDLLNDYEFYINHDDMYLSGLYYNKDIKEVDLGRLPEKDDEIIIIGNTDNWYIDNMADEMLSNTFRLLDNDDYKVRVSGIKYDNTIPEYLYRIKVSDKVKEDLLTYISSYYSKNTFKIYKSYLGGENSELYPELVVNNSLKSGEAYVKDLYNTYCKNFKCKNSKIDINVKNIYYEDNLTVKVKEVLTKSNSKRLVGKKIDEIYAEIFISKDDYNRLFNKDNYQSSVFVKNIKDINNIKKQLNELGINALSIRESKHNEAAMVMQLFKIIKLVVSIILVVVLFFICYLIIKIIYKSRNSYYTTLRTLGSTKKVCINILRKELITFATIVYLVFMLVMYLVDKNVIKISYFKSMLLYLNLYEYIIIYVIVILLSVLIANRYGRKIFKNSVIKTYGGEE